MKHLWPWSCPHSREIWERRDNVMGLVCWRCLRWRPATALVTAGDPKYALISSRGQGRADERGAGTRSGE